MPDVVGLPLNKASNVLAESGLEVGKQRQVVNNQFPEYHVMLQRPGASKVVRSGRKIHLTISAGAQFENAPHLVGRNLEVAKQQIDGTRMLLGSIARIPHDMSRDIVLGQDPPAGLDIAVGAEIHLLVSDGPSVRQVFMPLIEGRSIEDAMASLVELGVNIVPYSVATPGVEYDVVLEQNPPAGELLIQNQTVSFDARFLPTTILPDMRRKVALSYTVPATSARPRLRVDIVDRRGIRTTAYPGPNDPSRLRPNSKVKIEFSFADEATVEFYVDGIHQSSYSFEGSNDPVIHHFTTSGAAPRTANQGQGAPDTEDAPKRRRFLLLPKR